MSRTTDMTVGSPTKHIISFALPLILTNMGQQLYMIADAAIVGRGVGVKALASVGATDWIYWLILWTVIGLTQGFSAFIARCFGEQDYRQMNRTIATSMLLCGFISLVLTCAGLFAAKPLLLLLNTPADILPGALMYLTVMTAGTMIVAAYNMAASILRAFGDGKSPLIAMIVAASMNIGLDCLFVFVFRWGILGAALASVLAQAVSFLYCLHCLRKIDCICLGKEAWHIDIGLIKKLILFGIPVALRFIVISLGGIILQSSINAQGSTFIAGYTATNKVYGLLECSAIALGLACCTFLAQNYGAGQYMRVKQGVRTAAVIVCIMAVFVGTATVMLREGLMGLFLDISETGGPESFGIAVHYLTILASCLVILYLIHIFQNALQAMGISIWSMCSGFMEFAARIIMSKIVLRWIGTDALFLSEPAAWLGALLLVMLPYFYYRKKLLSSKT